jgi:subtilisin family serine protease
MFVPLACALGLSSFCLDETRIAAFDPALDREQLTARLTALGAGDVRPWAIPGWSIAATDGRERASDLADRVACDGNVAFVSPVFVGADGGPVFSSPFLLLRFAPYTTGAYQQAILDTLSGFKISEREFGAMQGAYRLHSLANDAREILAAAQALSLRADIVFAEPDWIFTGHGEQAVTNDPLYPQAWGLENTGQAGGTPDIDIDAPEAWTHTQGNPSVLIAILDTGVESAHPDLALSMVVGADFTSDGPGNGDPVNTFDSHGTGVAGCLVAQRNNLVGSCGVAPNCRAVSMRTFISILPDGTWTSQASWTVNALAAAQAMGARVTNNSNGYGFQSSAIDAKYLDLWNAGVVNFAAAGNGGAGVDYPAVLQTVNAVGSISRLGLLSPFSNTGPELDFVAPGETIITTDRVGPLGWDQTGDYAFVNGTSFATPFAAGIAALVLSTNPTLASVQVGQVMRNSCMDMGPPGQDPSFGYGLVNAELALVLACGQPTSYCVSSPNSVGPGAVMTSIGSQSLSANDLIVGTMGVPPNTTGLYFFGTAPVQVPFGNGFRCVGGNVIRLPVVHASLFGDVFQPIDTANLPQGQVVMPGDVRLFQLWYRNPAGGGAGFNLSDGLRVEFCP